MYKKDLLPGSGCCTLFEVTECVAYTMYFDLCPFNTPKNTSKNYDSSVCLCVEKQLFGFPWLRPSGCALPQVQTFPGITLPFSSISLALSLWAGIWTGGKHAAWANTKPTL